jgi:hypothetical protein
LEKDKMFLSVVKMFPGDIMFSHQPRFNKEGYHWYPISLMGVSRQNLISNVDIAPAILDKNGRGLSINAAGFVMTMSGTFPAQSGSPLYLKEPLTGTDEIFELKVPILEPAAPFAWGPGVEYGVRLSCFIVNVVRNR